MSVSMYIIRALVLSILRKNAHIPLLISLTPPILLATALLSIPSVSTVIEFLNIQETSVAVVLDRPVFINCYSVGIVEIDSSTLGFSTMALIVNNNVFNAISATISARPINNATDENMIASLPEELYFRLGKPARLELRIQDKFANEVQVRYVHKLVNALIIISPQKVSPQVYICITNKHSILRDIFLNMEKNFFAHIRAWIAILTASYIPLVYVASKIAVKRLSSEFKAFINLGLDPDRLALYAGLSMLVVTTLLTMFLYSLAIVILYTTYSFMSTIAFFVSPQPGVQGVVLVTSFSILCYPLFYISARRSIALEK